MRRTASRLATTLVAVASLLFMQLALASYVCPIAPADDEQTMAMDMAPGMPCHDATPDAGSQPTLCHHHCTNAAQSFEPIKLPTLTLPAIVQVLVVPLRVDPARQQAVAYASVGKAQPPPSPVFLATLRLRV